MNLAKCFVSATAVFLLATTASAAEPKSTIKSDNVAIQLRLTKLIYERAHRTTFWIEMESEQGGRRVKAVCDLRNDGVGVGRFPLEQVASRENADAIWFRIGCLHNDFVEDTVVHLLVRDEAFGKTVEDATIRLKNAVPIGRVAESATSISEIPAEGGGQK